MKRLSLATMVTAFLGIIMLVGGVTMYNQRQTERNDRDLLERVRRAVQHSAIAADNVERIVGTKAAINTRNAADRVAYETASMSADDEVESAIDRLYDADEVVYWVRPIYATNPRVVGIYWKGHDVPQMFFAVVLSPE